MRCSDIMKTEIQCVSPQDTVKEAAQKMRDANIGFLPVCDATKKVVGTLTDRDIAIRMVAEGGELSMAVADIMTSNVVACRPDDDLKRAEQLMGEHQKSRIVCLDDNGKLVGVISLSDVIESERDEPAMQTARQVTQRETTATF